MFTTERSLKIKNENFYISIVPLTNNFEFKILLKPIEEMVLSDAVKCDICMKEIPKKNYHVYAA